MLFSKRKQPAHQCEISYDDVVTYLRDLDQADHTKILKVVNTYREADKKVKKILGIKEHSVTNPNYIDQLSNDLLDDEPLLEDLLIDDEPVVPNKTKGKKAAKK